MSDVGPIGVRGPDGISGILRPAKLPKIYLLDRNPAMTAAWRRHFQGLPVEVVCSTFDAFMAAHNVQAIVSPGNSFGVMDGGYDLAITQHFGPALQAKVQAQLRADHGGEQVPGTAMTIPIDGSRVLIHTPTMRLPERIRDERIIYHCMRSTLLEAQRRHVESIVIPAFGAGVGGVPCDNAALYMRGGYDSVFGRKTR